MSTSSHRVSGRWPRIQNAHCDEAERFYRQSLEIKPRLGNQAGIAASFNQLGTLAQERGRYDEAERLLPPVPRDQ